MIDAKTHWQKIYQDKDPSGVSWYQEEPLLSQELIRNTGIAHTEALIDIGGGASVLVDRLLSNGYTNLSVLDISGIALAHAQERLGNLSDKVKWHEEDVTQFKAPEQFLLWHDRAVFHFLTEPSDRVRYTEVLKQSLTSGGHVIIAAFAIGGPEKCSGLNIVQYDAEKLSAEIGPDFQLVEQRSEVHVTPANKEQLFMYFRFQYQG